MNICTRLAGLLLTTITFGACGEGTPIAGSELPTMAMTDPEAGLPPGIVQITNNSAGVTAPGISVNAGTSNFNIGSYSIVGYNRTTLTNKFVFKALGSADASDVSGLHLWRNGQPLCHLDPNIVNNEAVIDLTDCPIRLAPGETANLLLKANIVSGVNRHAQFSLADATSVSAHDLINNPVPVTTNTGNWPLTLSYITINQGSLTAKRAGYFTEQSISTTTAGRHAMAVVSLAALGEAVRLTGFNLNLYFGGGLQPSDLTDLVVNDDTRGLVGTTISSVPGLNPRASFSNLNLIVPQATVANEIIEAKFRAGAQGTVQACLSDIYAQGFTSLAGISLPQEICGNIMTVLP